MSSGGSMQISSTMLVSAPGSPGGRRAKARPDLMLVRGLDDMQRPLAVAERAAEDDEAVIDESVHERRVLIPGVLVPDLARGIPPRSMGHRHREIGHDRR